MTGGPDARQVLLDGLWHQNTGLVVLLGLCPLLAVTGTVVNGLGLGLATMGVLLASNLSVSLIRGLLRPEIRIPAFVLIIASVVTAVELLMKAWLHELYLVLGIFIPLIVTNCAIIGRAEVFASKHGPGLSALDGLATGLGFCITLVLLGGVRELVGRGTLFADAHLLLGEAGQHLQLTLIPQYEGLLLAILPPGAFIALGLLVAAKNWLQARRSPSAAAEPMAAARAS
ncbi:MAG: electron transport complex subunit E [Xanthomonadales bacterium]|nr:electron transport complex subunit E [Xanthomonadales bacterium]